MKFTYLTFYFLELQAGTGIAELIALEMSKQVLIYYHMYVCVWLLSLDAKMSNI